jgi:ABC-type antimicrobial peptide transport system permease subunit
MGRDLARPFRNTQASLLGVLGVFAMTALALGAVGVYGVASYAVRCRRREIGVRMALGADRSQVVREVVFAGAARAAIGIPFGLLLTLGLARALQSLLFEVPSADPVTFTVVSALVLSVTIASLLLPAYAAASTDPAVATRSD